MNKPSVNLVQNVVQLKPLANQTTRALDEMNKEYAVITVGNKVRIIHEYLHPVTSKPHFDLLSEKDFLTLTKHRPAPGTDDNSVGQFWLAHPRRRQFLTMDFFPGTVPDSVYNLWRGFGVSPSPGNCEKFWTFVRDTICSGNEDHYRYVRKWTAHMIQRPDQLPETALVLRGLQGTGKSTLAHTLGHLVEPHYIELSGTHQVSGQFNSHLANVLLVNANEAIWGGRKSEEGALKAMITDPTTAIEGKGRDIVQVRNFKRLIVTTNEAWAVPMAADDRRFFVLDVSDNRKEDHAYFKELVAELQNGGFEALMHDLVSEDLGDFNPRQMPASAASFDLKLRSADSVTQWLYDLLSTGYHDLTCDIKSTPLMCGQYRYFANEAAVKKANESGVIVETEYLYLHYLRYGARSEPKPQFVKRLRQLLPSLRNKRVSTTPSRPRAYVLPALDDARTQFEQNFKLQGKVPWEEPKAGL